MASIVPQSRATLPHGRLVHTSSNLAGQLDRAAAETKFPFEKRALFIRKWVIKLCLSSHDIANPKTSCCGGCWGHTQVCCVDTTSKGLSGLISLVCCVATLGIHTCCYECPGYLSDRNRATKAREQEENLDRRLEREAYNRTHPYNHRRSRAVALNSGQLGALVESVTVYSSPASVPSDASSAVSSDRLSVSPPRSSNKDPSSLPPLPQSVLPARQSMETD